MNIIELSFSKAWGGLEIYIGVFAKEFIKRGHNVIGIVNSNSKLESEFRNNSIEYFALEPNLKYLDFVTAKKIKSSIGERKIDILHTHESKVLSTSILLKKLLKSSKLVFSQQMDSRFNKNDIFHRWIYKNLDHVIAMTSSMRLNHIKHTPVQNSQISVIYNGIDLKRFSSHNTIDRESFLSTNNIPSGKIIIGTVARLDRLKNQELLVDAAMLLLKEKKYNIHFVLIGDETDSITGKGYKEELISKIRYHGIENYFTFFGFTNKIEQYFDIMDIFVLPTHKESFGYVLIEAMANGKPVLASNQGGPIEIIDDGINGYLFDSKNISELSKKLSSLIDNESLRKSMGEESIKIVESKFDVNVTIDKYLRLFQTLVIS
jgi:glycosyltransferase involved in cell wall biosynthesis